MTLYRDPAGNLFNSNGARLDPLRWVWSYQRDDHPAHEGQERQAISLREAVCMIYGQHGTRKIPVGIIGPNEPSSEMIETAEKLGKALGSLHVPILCGGRGGVMEAASRGAFEAGGLTLGFLRGTDWADANDYVTIPLATGIGHARNAVIAQASVALVAVGGQYGTHSEAAFGMVFGKAVFGLCHAPDIEGVQHMDSVDAVLDALAPILLHIPSSPSSSS